MPKKYFTCDKQGGEQGGRAAPAAVGKKDSPIDCVKQGTEDDCDELDQCSWWVWCTDGRGGAACGGAPGGWDGRRGAGGLRMAVPLVGVVGTGVG